MEKTGEQVVVVVDDDPVKRYSVSRVLGHAGYSVVEASNAADALKTTTQHPDLLMLDIRLPDMTGYELCRRLKQEAHTASIPVLLLSASFTDAEHKAHGLDVGAEAYLTHPVEPVVLLATVRSLLRLRQAESVARKSQEALEEAYRKQKRIAETLQLSLLIDVPEDAYDQLKVARFYESAGEDSSVGGDFYDTFKLSGGKVALVIGDATGKGLAAAIRTAEVKFVLRAYLHDYEDPATGLGRVNNFLYDSANSTDFPDSMVAAVVAVVDTHAGQVTFAAAGSEPPLILGEDLHPRSVQTSGLPLGAFANTEYVNVTARFDPGETIVLATDGVTEARQGKEFLSYDGMVNLAAQHLGTLHTLHEQGQCLLDAARTFAGGTFQDDVCILLARSERPCRIDRYKTFMD